MNSYQMLDKNIKVGCRNTVPKFKIYLVLLLDCVDMKNTDLCIYGVVYRYPAHSHWLMSKILTVIWHKQSSDINPAWDQSTTMLVVIVKHLLNIYMYMVYRRVGNMYCGLKS